MQDERTTTPLEWGRSLARDASNGLSWRAIAVAGRLADHANRAGICSVLQATIATEARISARAVRYGLTELREAGWIEERRTRGASVFVLKTGTACQSQPSESGTTCQSDPARVAPDATQTGTTCLQKKVLKENQEVSLSKGSHGEGHSSGAEEVLIPLGSLEGNDPATKGLDSFTDAVREMAPEAWRILNGGFVGLMDPKPHWKRPTAYGVAKVLTELGSPHWLLVEHAARQARLVMQRHEDGSNVVALFKHKLKVEVDKAAGVRASVLKSLERPAA